MVISKEIKSIRDLLVKRSKIVVTTHQNPDGDALGSMLGMYWFLKGMGHDVSPISPNDYPEFLQWLPGNEAVLDYVKHKNQVKSAVAAAEIIFYLDYNEDKRGGDMKELLNASKASKIMLDHHPFPQLPVDVAISRTEVSSTCELVYEFIVAMDGTRFMTKDIASCIYAGIMTDTGCFAYNSSRPRTFEIVAQLMSHSIDKDDIFRRIYDNYSEHRMRLLGYCLNDKMKVFPEYRTAFIALSMEEQDRFKFETGDSEGFVNYPLSIKGICFTALFVERKDKVKISLRSRGSFAVNEFSKKHFGGGGHTNAAGGESLISLSETIQKFVDLLPQYANDLNS
jgi:Exopolyphosphatase-related proteins